MRLQLSPVLVAFLVLCRQTWGDTLQYRDGPIPIGIQPNYIGQRNTQIRAPGHIDVSNLTFASQRGDAITINIIFMRKIDDEHPFELSNEDFAGVLDPNYCNTENQAPIIDYNSLQGFHLQVDLLSNGTNARYTDHQLPDPEAWGHYDITASGDFVLLLSTCQDNQVYASGVVTSRSSYGYLPAAQVNMALAMVVFAVFGMTMACCYGSRLFCRSDINGTLTEKVIFWALAALAFQGVFMVIHYWQWNATGQRHRASVSAVLLLELVKHALTYGVAVMMSLGQGYSRSVVALGIWYILLSLTMEILRFTLDEIRMTNFDTWSKVFDIISIVYYGTDILVVLLVLCFLTRTMRYLRRANQYRKLRRYRAFVVVLIFVLVGSIGAIVATKMSFYGFMVSQLSFVAILTTMACLWWPSSENEEYERVMELPYLDDEGNELVAGYDDEFGSVEMGKKQGFDAGINAEYGESELGMQGEEHLTIS